VILKTVAEADMAAKQAKSFWCCILTEVVSKEGKSLACILKCGSRAAFVRFY
jgi:hypothetical protein